MNYEILLAFINTILTIMEYWDEYWNALCYIYIVLVLLHEHISYVHVGHH